MRTVTVAAAKENLESLIEQTVLDVEPTLVMTESGQSVVLLSLEEFNAWQETLYLLSTPANAQHLHHSIAEVEAGYTITPDLIEP